MISHRESSPNLHAVSPTIAHLPDGWDVDGALAGSAHGAISLADFVANSATSLREQEDQKAVNYARDFTETRDACLRAGVEVLIGSYPPSRSDWRQIGIRPTRNHEGRGELLGRVGSLVRELMADTLIDNFFFMNKDPGLRIRFEARSAASQQHLGRIVDAEVDNWRADGLIDFAAPGVYEPESRLFGGVVSTTYVHALFTLDSLFWLDYHARPTNERAVSGPTWLVSLALLRFTLDGLGILGWEDIGVWEQVRSRAGRQLGTDAKSGPSYAAIARALGDVWSQREALVQALCPADRMLVNRYENALREGSAHWLSGYFNRGYPSVGPRSAAAFYVVYHWNRAALAVAEQALLAEALAARME